MAGAASDEQLVSKRWNTETQTPHGGQEWREVDNFVDDFSVTTNPLGPPPAALAAASEAIQDIGHYPPADFEPAFTALADYVWQFPESYNGLPKSQLREQLLLGNGSSELIELCVRTANEWYTDDDGRRGGVEGPPCPSEEAPEPHKWREGPFETQYQEYKRTSEALGRVKAAKNDKSARLLCIVNPCNPTGDFMKVEEMKSYISEQTSERTTVIVDESMLPFFGPNWQSESFSWQGRWLSEMASEKKVFVFVIHSWTKFFCCPGLRLGSVLAPTTATAFRLKKLQVPWTVNCAAVAFLDAAVKEHSYMSETYTAIATWRKHTLEALRALRPNWTVHGVESQPFLWIDTGDEKVARKVVASCKGAGVPIRWGYPGYNMPCHIRIAVRPPERTAIVLKAIAET